MGAPKGHSGPGTDRMNDDPEQASMYCGRILIEYYSEEVK